MICLAANDSVGGTPEPSLTSKQAYKTGRLDLGVGLAALLRLSDRSAAFAPKRTFGMNEKGGSQRRAERLAACELIIGHDASRPV
jgi:hypothetical protein